jgi:hypothetical protein
MASMLKIKQTQSGPGMPNNNRMHSDRVATHLAVALRLFDHSPPQVLQLMVLST